MATDTCIFLFFLDLFIVLYSTKYHFIIYQIIHSTLSSTASCRMEMLSDNLIWFYYPSRMNILPSPPPMHCKHNVSCPVASTITIHYNIFLYTDTGE